MVRPFEVSVRFSSFDYSDVLGVGIFPPCLVVNVHPASAHTLDLDLPAIHVHCVCVDCGNRHFGGSALGPPLNQ